MNQNEDKDKLISWVEDLPRNCGTQPSFSAVCRMMAERYHAQSGDLQQVLLHYMAQIRSQLDAQLSEKARANQGLITYPDLITALDKATRQALLQMWCYSSEYQRRWGVPEIFDQFNLQLTDLFKELGQE